jgi:sigma-B regulation protein RsbU (phosphoserine phosphatase)
VLTLLPGEKLVLYSDGILESTNHAGLRYPLERFKDLLSRHARASSKELLRVAQADFDVWRQGRESPDDISMLIIEGLEH